MSFASISDALNQLNANLPPWPSQASAGICLSAATYLQVNRAQSLEETTTSFRLEKIENLVCRATKFLGASAPRAFGRSRRVTAIPRVGGIA